MGGDPKRSSSGDAGDHINGGPERSSRRAVPEIASRGGSWRSRTGGPEIASMAPIVNGFFGSLLSLPSKTTGVVG
jgi:hypothetical protein